MHAFVTRPLEVLDSESETEYRGVMVHSLTITLDDDTFAWLTRQAAAEQTTVAKVVEELLHELADPDAVEGDLIDRLLMASTDSFPPIMTLDEQDECREEILDDLCRRIVEGYAKRVGEPLSEAATATLREQLVARSKQVWG
jgi:hypothetical protein